MDTVKRLINSIRCEVFHADMDEALFRHVSPAEWEDLYALSKKHDLAHIVGNFVGKHHLIADKEQQALFDTHVVVAVKRVTKQTVVLEQVRAALEQAHIPFVVLKGSVIRTLYPEDWMRTSSDMDILVEPQFLSQAQSVLETELHFTANKQRFHDVALTAPNGVVVELHFSLLESMKNIDVCLKDAMQYAVSTDENRYEQTFTPEFFLFHLVAHIYYHFICGGCGIRPFVDLKLILDKIPYNKAKLRALLSTAKIAVFFEKIVFLSRVWFGDETHNDLSRMLEEYVVGGGLFGSSKNKVLTAQSQSGKFRSIMNRIFLPYESLCYRFSKARIPQYQIPFYQMARWIILLREGSAKRGMNFLKTHTTTKSDDIEKMQMMLTELGLTD